MCLHSHVQWETLNSNFKQSNKDKEIINRTLIVSYFLIFLLVFILMFMIKVSFFKYTASEAVEYTDYTGSIHVGIDTTEGDYYIQNTSGLSSDYVYGVKLDKDSNFTTMAYSDHQILQLKRGEHIILYKANLIPVDATEHSDATAKLDSYIASETNELDSNSNITQSSTETVGSSQSSDVLLSDTDGMIKLSNQYYNIPYVFVADGENPYIELYDKDVNVLSFEVIENEHIYSIAPTEATYLKLNDVKVYSFNNYVSSGRNQNGSFADGVYIVGRGIESGQFLLEPTSASCQYRIIDGEENVGSTTIKSCVDAPQIVELETDQIVEFHGATLTIYNGDYQA